MRVLFGPGFIAHGATRDENPSKRVPVVDATQDIRVLPIVVDKQTHDAVTPQVFNLKLLLYGRIPIFHNASEISALDPPQQTVVLPPVFAEKHTYSAQDVIQVGIVETETDEEKCFRDQIPPQRR